jgi:hypothetical protein
MGTCNSFGKDAQPPKENPLRSKKEKIMVLQKVLEFIRWPSFSLLQQPVRVMSIIESSLPGLEEGLLR